MAQVAPIGVFVNEVQTITITGTPSGGDFTLALDAADGDPILFNDNAAAADTALEASTNIGAGQVAVTGTNPNFVATFGGTLAHTNVSLLTLSDNSLTGGTTPTVVIATTTAGADGSGLLTPATRCRFLGYSLRETAAAVGTAHFRDGSATGRILATVRFAASTSRHAWYGPQGIWAETGIYYEWVAGTITGSVRWQ